MQGARCATEETAFKEFQAHGFVRVIVRDLFELGANFDLDAQLFLNLATKATFKTLAGLDLSAWEFPEIRKMISGPALRDEKLPVMEN